jgi:hypothetical protein
MPYHVELEVRFGIREVVLVKYEYLKDIDVT